MLFQSFNPSTGEPIAERETLTDNSIDAILGKAYRAFIEWRGMTFGRRAEVLMAAADAIDADRRHLAELITLEMGKPISQALAEVDKSSGLCRYYAKNAANYLAAERIVLPDGHATVVPEPLGVIYSITPWNFPVWQLVRLAVPALAAGNAVVVKPALNVVGAAERLLEAFARSGAPDGLYQSLSIDHEQSDRVIADPRIAAVGLTGSERAGSAVAASAGRHLKKVVLELGGSDPFIVLADADVARAAKTAAIARFQNAGQVCIAAKRIIVERSIWDTFMHAFLGEIQAMTIGDPMREDVFIGPMARDDLRAEVQRQTSQTIAAGSRILRRGGPMDGPGYFYSPTVLEGGQESSPFHREEIFGPAVLVLPSNGDDEILRIANATPFGLSAAVWTRDQERAQAIAQKIEAGCVFVNSMSRSDPAFPLGGQKRSGFGRELGKEGTREYTNLKTIFTADVMPAGIEASAADAVERGS